MTHKVKKPREDTPLPPLAAHTHSDAFTVIVCSSLLRASEDVLHSSGADYDLLNGRAGAISSLWYEETLDMY